MIFIPLIYPEALPRIMSTILMVAPAPQPQVTKPVTQYGTNAGSAIANAGGSFAGAVADSEAALHSCNTGGANA